MKRKRIVTKVLVTMGILLGLFCGAKDMKCVRAEEVSELSQLMTANEDVDMKAAPKSNAETIVSYQKGSSVFVTGETADGWYRAIYQDKEGYIPQDLLSVQEMDVEELDAEMAQVAGEGKFMIETIDQYQREARRSKIWGSVIVILIVGVFATGIVSEVRGRKSSSEHHFSGK